MECTPFAPHKIILSKLHIIFNKTRAPLVGALVLLNDGSRARTHFNGTVRWTVPAASSKTGCLLTVCLWQTGNRARPPAPQSRPDFDRVGVGFFFLIFGELPIYPVILEQIRHIRICSLKCSRYSLNDYLSLRSPNKVVRSTNTQ